MINILNKKFSNRTLLIAISFIAVFQLSVIWLRTGYYPLPAGDDVMFADSAYNLITEGKLRKTIFGDDHIRDYKDFWPPIIMLVQALSFFMFGLSQFSMGFPSSLLATILFFIFFLLAKSVSGSTFWSLVGVTVILSSEIATNVLFTVRPEIAFNTLFILYILLSYDSTKERKFYNAPIIKGIIIGLCVLSYYPLAPFVIFAMIIFHFLISDKSEGLTKIVYDIIFQVLGLIIPLALYTIYFVYPDFNLFYKSVISVGENSYGPSKGNTLFTALKSLVLANDKKRFVLIVLEYVYIIVVSLYALTFKNKMYKALSTVSLIMISSTFFYGRYEFASTAIIITFLILVSIMSELTNPKRLMFLRLLLICFTTLAFTRLILVFLTVILQHEGRNYSFVEKRIMATVNSPCVVVASPVAWLALKEKLNSSQLYIISPNHEMAKVFNNPINIDKFDYAVIDTKEIKTISANLPIISYGFTKDKLQKVDCFNPINRLPWANPTSYNITIYRVQH